MLGRHSKLLKMRRTQVQQRLAVDRLLLHRRRIHARLISKLLAQSLHKRAHIFNRPTLHALSDVGRLRMYSQRVLEYTHKKPALPAKSALPAADALPLTDDNAP